MSVSQNRVGCSSTANSVEIAVDFRGNDPVFDGHYPDNPIYPASFLVEMCFDHLKHRVSSEIGVDDDFYLANSTFSQAIRPDAQAVFYYEYTSPAKTAKKLRVSILVNDVPVASLTFKKGQRIVDFPETGHVEFLENHPPINCLPQRYPLLVIDRLSVDASKKIGFAQKFVSYTDYGFRRVHAERTELADYSYPVGAVIEGVEQSAALIIGAHWPITDRQYAVVIGGLSGVTEFSCAYPGDTITFHTALTYLSDNTAILSGIASVDERVLLSIEKIFVVIKPS